MHANTILHIDMDAFYASVEQRDRPELRGRPVIVGATGNRGVVCAASYEARAFGVRSAMSISMARRLCPHAAFLPVQMARYVTESRAIRDIFDRYTPLVEPLSLDEAFLDIRGCESLHGNARAVGRKIKSAILQETGLIASVGIASNKFLAKLASDSGKPDGFVEIEPGAIQAFLDPLPIGRLWGVGAKCEARFKTLGIETVGALSRLDPTWLAEAFGPSGSHLWKLAHGLDSRPVVPDREAKSISTESTFEEDISDRERLRSMLLDLVDYLAVRLRQHGLKAKSMEVKLRSSTFETHTCSARLCEPTDSSTELWLVAKGLLPRLLRRDTLPARLLGVAATRLARDGMVQTLLFDRELRKRQSDLDVALDSIQKQFGRAALRRGSSLQHNPSRLARGEPQRF